MFVRHLYPTASNESVAILVAPSLGLTWLARALELDGALDGSALGPDDDEEMASDLQTGVVLAAGDAAVQIQLQSCSSRCYLIASSGLLMILRLCLHLSLAQTAAHNYKASSVRVTTAIHAAEAGGMAHVD